MRTKISIAILSLALVTLAGCASVQPVNSIPAEIANATTAQDHERIAGYFAQKAANYDRDSVSHEEMALSYRARPKGEPSSMIAHCRALRDQLAAAAREARELEQAHRQLAKSVAK